LRQKLLSTLLGREHQRYMQARSHTKWLSKFLNSHMTSWEMYLHMLVFTLYS
jgi:hypothetical protein